MGHKNGRVSNISAIEFQLHHTKEAEAKNAHDSGLEQRVIDAAEEDKLRLMKNIHGEQSEVDIWAE